MPFQRFLSAEHFRIFMCAPRDRRKHAKNRLTRENTRVPAVPTFDSGAFFAISCRALQNVAFFRVGKYCVYAYTNVYSECASSADTSPTVKGSSVAPVWTGAELDFSKISPAIVEFCAIRAENIDLTCKGKFFRKTGIVKFGRSKFFQFPTVRTERYYARASCDCYRFRKIQVEVKQKSKKKISTRLHASVLEEYTFQKAVFGKISHTSAHWVGLLSKDEIEVMELYGTPAIHCRHTYNRQRYLYALRGGRGRRGDHRNLNIHYAHTR